MHVFFLSSIVPAILWGMLRRTKKAIMKIANGEVSLMIFLISFKICAISTRESPVDSEFLKVPKILLEHREVACRTEAGRVTTNP